MDLEGPLHISELNSAIAFFRLSLTDRLRRNQKRRRTPFACSDGTTAGVVEFRITRSLGARLNTASGTPLHCPRRTKLIKSIELAFDSRQLRISVCRHF